MNKRLGVTDHVIDEIIASAGEEDLSFSAKLRIGIHLFFCPRCAREAKILERLHEVMVSDFFPPSPDFENPVMEKLSAETGIDTESGDAPAGFSFRGWIIAGCFVFLSLPTVFFGMDFIKAPDAQSSSFLLPLGLTIGGVLTGYGAFFIGSHLKKLSSHFRLH
ncbi:MAG: peptidoglycan-binding protein [Treponema sp.]|jgi:hypothetical protein|nr:peptidoglycan-binding protein [Treponema sp.]